MASGKKNYFRHSFNAFEDEKIQKAIDLLGYQGYAYYFILLELLGKQCENEVKNPITIHIQTLRNVWRKHTKSCIKVVEKLQQSGLFYATFNESLIEFDIPNLAKYLGKYTNKNPPNAPNKIKENKIKENKIKINKNESKNTDKIKQVIEILDYLNNKTNRKYKPDNKLTNSKINSLLNAKHNIDDIKKVIDAKASQWLGTDMDKYLRPMTLFGNKFETYLEECQEEERLKNERLEKIHMADLKLISALTGEPHGD